MKRFIHSRRGSVILMVMIFTTILGLLGASLIAYTLTERRLNHRNKLRFEAKNAAEAALEYAASEVRARLTRNLNFAADEFSTTPITAHSTRLAQLLPTVASEFNHVAPGDVSLWVSQITEPTRRYIDPSNPGNDFDPLRGQTVTAQSVRFLARARSADPVAEAWSYATQEIEVRDAALFNYAIFYNLDMEFHPSPAMTVVGPVHSNQNAYLTEQSTLKLLDTFTTAGTLTIGTIGSGRPSGRNISFTTGVDDNSDGVLDVINANNPTINGTSLGTYVDSNLASRKSGYNFRDTASQLWNGNLQDSSHGITQQTPPGVLSTSQAHDLIEPPDAAGTAAVESQKYANKAGLYFLVEADGTTRAFYDPAAATAYKASGNTTALRAAWRAANANKLIDLPPNMINKERRMYDHREGRWINMIDIDLGTMRTAVAASTAGAPENFKISGTGADWSIDDANDGWNGIVYVDVERPSNGFTSTGLTYKKTSSNTYNQGSGSGSRTAVRLLNASSLPNRRAADPSNAFLAEGLSIATNAPVYTVGHYNADGSLASDLSDMTTPETNEVPAAIIADAINVLSSGWAALEHGTGKFVPAGDETSQSSTRPAAGNTEVSAALLTGIVSTSGTASSAYSGGVENYPRFHEEWSGRSLRYRGSIVALFESEIARGAWNSAKYGAPKREWGFNSMFGSQRRYPPGTPIIRTFRRLDYRDVSIPEFNTLLADAHLNFTAM